jgi:hypothetical protein
MIFVVETEECTLRAFPTEEEAIANCEGLDVEAAVWLFWNDRGEPLEPEFSVPNKRGLFAVRSGIYSLIPATLNHHANLEEALDEILNYEGPPPFSSAEAVRDYVGSQTRE